MIKLLADTFVESSPFCRKLRLETLRVFEVEDPSQGWCSTIKRKNRTRNYEIFYIITRKNTRSLESLVLHFLLDNTRKY